MDGLGRNFNALVVIPTYNEIENIEIVVRGVHRFMPRAHILVVDDNSPDGTGVVADRLATVDSRVHVVHGERKGGLGAAYLRGFGWALDSNYDVVVEMDADGSHDPADLVGLMEALGQADLVIGSRWIAGGRVVNWPRWRRLLSRAGNAYSRWMLRTSLRDITGGFRAFRANALRAIDLSTVSSQGYCFQVDVAVRAELTGLIITEVPITFVERQRGSSKMSMAIVLEALWKVTLWSLKSGTRYRTSSCGPVSDRGDGRGPGAEPDSLDSGAELGSTAS